MKRRRRSRKLTREQLIDKLLPDALLIERLPYGIRAKVPALDHVYVICWRYDAMPSGYGDLCAVFEWLRDVGETLPPRCTVHYGGGLVHRRP